MMNHDIGIKHELNSKEAHYLLYMRSPMYREKFECFRCIVLHQILIIMYMNIVLFQKANKILVYHNY